MNKFLIKCFSLILFKALSVFRYIKHDKNDEKMEYVTEKQKSTEN